MFNCYMVRLPLSTSILLTEKDDFFYRMWDCLVTVPSQPTEQRREILQRIAMQISLNKCVRFGS